MTAADPLEAIRAQFWADLGRAVADRRSSLRTPVLATRALDGAPAQRILVLRKIDPAAATLELHTDARSAKCAEIAAEPAVSLLFWDPKRQIQQRVSGLAEIIAGGPDHAAAWAATPAVARRSYGAEPPPGAPLDAADAQRWESDDRAARAFRLLRVRIHRLDMLTLDPAGHRRAVLDWSGSGAPAGGHWAAP